MQGIEFAGPLPRACQITSIVHLFQQLLQHFLFLHLLQFSTVKQISNPFSFLQRFGNPVQLGFSAQFTFFFCKNLEHCFNCCSNNRFLSEQCAREAASPGASWHWSSSPFESGGAPFFESVYRKFSFTRENHIFPQTLFKHVSCLALQGTVFRKRAKTKKCISTAPARTDCL